MRVVAYVRVSSEEQATQGISLEAQRAKVKAYAELHDLELVETLADEGVSAKSLKRPGLQTALALIASGKADGLVVCKLDRLSRSVADWNYLIDRFFGEKAGKQLLSVQDSIDTRTAAGRLVLNVLMSVAQWEREATGERTREVLRHKKSKGERTGQIPFGFELASDGIKLIANAAEQQALDMIRKARAEGVTIREIAAELTRQCIPTKEGKSQWHPTAVHRIIRRAA